MNVRTIELDPYIGKEIITMEDYNSTLLRIRSYIKVAESWYPKVWKQLAELRAKMKKDQSDPYYWPNWCYVPSRRALKILSHYSGIEPSDSPDLDLHFLEALGAWRLSQGIYKFHPDLLKRLLDSKGIDKLPVDHLYRLPEFCLYLSFSEEELELFGMNVYGFFVYWDFDRYRKENLLRVLLDSKDGSFGSMVLTLRTEYLADNIKITIDEASRASRKKDGSGDFLDYSFMPEYSEYSESWTKILNMILYLCAENAEISDVQGKKTAPRQPSPVKIKEGYRIFPTESPTFWLVGFETGEMLKREEEKERQTRKSAEERWAPRPHLRRAHWHSFWTGHRNEEQKLILRWLYPMLIGTKIKEEVNDGQQQN